MVAKREKCCFSGRSVFEYDTMLEVYGKTVKSAQSPMQFVHMETTVMFRVFEKTDLFKHFFLLAWWELVDRPYE